MDMIKDLLDVEQELTTWFFSATPKTAEDQASMARLLALRDQIHEDVNLLVRKRLQLAALGFADETAGLNALSARMKATTKSIDSVLEVIEIASQVTSITASIVPHLGSL